MKKSTVIIPAAALCLLMLGSCASKKELEAYKLQNTNLTNSYQESKEQLAASNARVT